MSGRSGQGWARCLPRVFAAAAAAVGLYGAALLVAVPGLARGPASVADIAEGLQDAVVNISTTQTLKGPDDGAPIRKGPKGSPFEEFFDDFFDEEGPDGMLRKVSSLGSGFVIDPSGLIVTNNHVIEGADEIIVNFNDGSKLKVTKILGHDPKTDLALLKVEPSRPLKSISFGDSSALRVGDWVMAIGNPFGLGGSVTVGVVSATKRDINAGPYDDFIQTDAAINRGNSGGPLFNMEGEVVGVNTAIISPTGGSIGIGFAVPSDTAVKVLDQLKEYGETRRGWLGVHVQNVTEEMAPALGLDAPRGALVASVTPDGPAAAGGIKPRDVILGFDGQSIRTMRDLPRAVAGGTVGKDVLLKVLRGGKAVDVTVTLGRLPEEDDDIAEPQEGARPETDDLLGLTIAPLTHQLRDKFRISGKVEGVVVTDVKPDSPAAKKHINAGDVIVEVTQEAVRKPEEVVARLRAVRKSGRPRVLFLLADADGELRFVAIPVS
ncbi:Do family serine endopeptidase [Methyloceanibacter sp.]|uniref:Do family serine endopeptidase n=1 Tax=Methyloceanibacter sp. TaxID=1965321 RepID=UPI002BB89850|nr:Do family serine endopeptidase [Methyloceanibacter sp.]HML92529.1 Do family serine endopeptidase [Methyloceanibacter sp.]